MARTRAVAMSLSILSVLLISTFSYAAAPDRIGAITSGQTVRLASGVPLQARPEFDQGAVDPAMKMGYITLLTKPTAVQQKAINKLLAEQQNPRSASYHKWLTPEQYADRFGLSQNDAKKITDWLQSQGFSVVKTARGRNWIVFSGNAAQVDRSFRTELHNFKVNGETHFANTKPAAIPAALSEIVTGFRGFNNFRPRSQAHRAKPTYTISLGGGTYNFLAPGDIATMYDLNALYSQGFDGTGQRLAVIGETDVFLDDLADFRSGFGLSAVNCTTTGSPGIITSCNTSNFKYVLIAGDTDPGYVDSLGDDLPEADIDLEWSGATARNAQIIYVNAPDPSGNGIYDSMYDAIDNDYAPVMTMSYSFPCEFWEAYFGTYVADENEFTQANLEGITFMNSSGDTGAAECDYGNSTAVSGYAVAYPASSPEITGVGGTLIPWDEYSATYWGANNGTDGGSLKKYAPENVWNDAQEISIFCTDNPSSCDPAYTSWQDDQEQYFGLIAGGGGVSNCITLDAHLVCTGGIPQPTWQSGIQLSSIDPGNGGVLNTPTRYSPDVSLLASIYWPGYIICTADSELGGGDDNSACSPGGAQGIINNMTNYGYSWGGTSISSPIFAGIVSMLNQYLNGSTNAGLGNINTTLYTLAATPSNNYFHPLTSGSNGAWCQPGTPTGVSGDPWPTNLVCPSSGPNTAFLGFDASNSDPTTGYNAAVGLGSVDAANLFAAWAAIGLNSTTTTLSSSENPSTAGDSVTFTATVTDTSGTSTPTGTVNFLDGATQIGSGTLSIPGGRNGVITSASATFPTSTLSSSGSPHSITAVYVGDSNDAGSTSNVVSQVVNAPSFSLANPTAPPTPLAGQSTTSTFTVTPTSGPGGNTFSSAVTFGCSGLPDSTVTCSVNTGQTNPNQIAAGTTGPVNVTLTIATSGPNSGTAGGVRHAIRRRAENRPHGLPILPMTFPLASVVMVGIVGRKRPKYATVAGMCIALVLLGLLLACGSSSSPIGVTATSSSNSIYPQNTGWTNSTLSLTATVTNDSSNQGVTWAVSPTESGQQITTTDPTHATYNPPTIAVGLPSSVSITATSVSDTSKSSTPLSITLTPTTIPTAIAGGPYSITVNVTEEATMNPTSAISLSVD